MPGKNQPSLEQRFRPAGRGVQANAVLEQGLARAFPIPGDDPFMDLLSAIDAADKRRK